MVFKRKISYTFSGQATLNDHGVSLRSLLSPCNVTNNRPIDGDKSALYFGVGVCPTNVFLSDVAKPCLPKRGFGCLRRPEVGIGRQTARSHMQVVAI